MAKRLAGTCYFKVDGTQLEVESNVECPLSDSEKEELNSTVGLAGYKETFTGHYVKGTFFFTPDFPIEKVTKGVDMSITVEFPNGKVYGLGEAFMKGGSSVKSESGTMELEFRGKTGGWQ